MMEDGKTDSIGNEADHVTQTSEADGVRNPEIRIHKDGEPDVVIRLDGLPPRLIDSVCKPAKPPSFWTTFFKDVAPGLTALAAVLISITGLVFTQRQRAAADIEKERASEAAKKKVLVELISNFGHEAAVKNAAENQDAHLELAAMKLAAYGDQALPAVKMALGADDDGLRYGGVLVAEQIYRSETVQHERLSGEILSYYGSTSPRLRQGVLEWLVKMGHQLSNDEATFAVNMLKSALGESAQRCNNEDRGVAMEATNFLAIWSTEDSRNLLSGMSSKCNDREVQIHATDNLKGMK